MVLKFVLQNKDRYLYLVIYYCTKMQCRKGKINWSLSITCEKIAHSIHHKEDSDESQFTVSFEVESLLFFTSGHYDCKKKHTQKVER